MGGPRRRRAKCIAEGSGRTAPRGRQRCRVQTGLDQAMKIKPGPEHEAMKLDLAAVLRKHSTRETSAVEMLAIASIMVGQLIALQDHQTMTTQMAMEIVLRNIEIGNVGAIDALGASQPN